MAQTLTMVCNEYQNDWDAHLPHVEYAYNNSVNAATGLAPNQVHIGRLPRLPLAAFDRSHGGAHQSFDRDHLTYCDLARERQQRAYKLVREQHALTVARINGRNFTLSDALLDRPKYVAGGWVWVFNTAATTRQGLPKGADNKVLKEKLSLNWTGPFTIIAVGPSPAHNQLDGRPLGDKLQYLDLPSNMSGPAAKPRITVVRCKSCANDVATPPMLHDVAKITGHQCVRGRGGAIAVLYETHWDGLLPHGNVNLTSKPSDIASSHIGPLDQHSTSLTPVNINKCVLMQPPERSPAQKGNATSRVPTDSSRTMFTVPALYPTPYPLEPPSGTTSLTVPGG